MNITINKREYKLAFGFDFLDYLNKNNSMMIEVDGKNVSTGLGGVGLLGNTLANKLPSTLKLIIKAATAHNDFKPSNKDLDEFVNGLIKVETDDDGNVTYDESEYNNLFDELLAELKKQPLVLKEMGLI
uniref:tail assembly chaperone n=1 Tax=Aerococcus urinaeequi TaxID=51665 RepID=UPI00352A6933